MHWLKVATSFRIAAFLLLPYAAGLSESLMSLYLSILALGGAAEEGEACSGEEEDERRGEEGTEGQQCWQKRLSIFHLATHTCYNLYLSNKSCAFNLYRPVGILSAAAAGLQLTVSQFLTWP